MARYIIMDYDKAMAAVVASANTIDEKSAVESVPKEQHLPNRVAVVRTSAIQEFFVLASELLDETPTLIVRDSTIINDKTPPAAPASLAAQQTTLSDGGTQVVVLTWEPGGMDQDLAGFYVYRDGVQIGGAGVLMFVDGTVPDGDHVYDVHAVDNAGNKSEPATVTVAVGVRSANDPPIAPRPV